MGRSALAVVVLGLALASSASTASEPVPAPADSMYQYETVFAHLTLFHTKRTKGAKLRVLNDPPRILFDYDDATNVEGDPDRPILLKAGKLAAARALVDRIVAASKAGTAPTQSDASSLYDLIDPQSK